MLQSNNKKIKLVTLLNKTEVDNSINVADAIQEEQQGLSSQHNQKVLVFKDKLNEQITMIRKKEAHHINRVVAVECGSKLLATVANLTKTKVKGLMQRNSVLRTTLKDVSNNNKSLHNKIDYLNTKVEGGEKMLTVTKLAALPITIIQKVRLGEKGAPSCPLYIWKLILKQVVNCTPPSSVASNIIAHVQAFSSTTVIKELPSIWTIRRWRTILAIVVQTLAAYCLGPSSKRGQLFTDGTRRRQILFRTWLLASKMMKCSNPLYS